ncbi:MAG: tRNA (adenosine(37)-N6)-threonylcarbamoyltransferase complex transferase subunit TsaD, partial [Patescibacteria group bacterium]
PALVLVVSGGHTDLVMMKNHGNFKWIGGTRDDAAGEAFDKCARLLSLLYPGGPSISSAAEKFNFENPKLEKKLFPRPLINDDNFDWSFSGLKTAVLRTVQNTKDIEQRVPEIAAEVQEAIVDSLVYKCQKAIDKFKPKSFLLSGGVAANSRLREKFMHEVFAKNEKTGLHVPEAKLCTDNAAAIAACAYYNDKPVSWKKITANPELTIVS